MQRHAVRATRVGNRAALSLSAPNPRRAWLLPLAPIRPHPAQAAAIGGGRARGRGAAQTRRAAPRPRAPPGRMRAVALRRPGERAVSLRSSARVTACDGGEYGSDRGPVEPGPIGGSRSRWLARARRRFQAPGSSGVARCGRALLGRGRTMKRARPQAPHHPRRTPAAATDANAAACGPVRRQALRCAPRRCASGVACAPVRCAPDQARGWLAGSESHRPRSTGWRPRENLGDPPASGERRPTGARRRTAAVEETKGRFSRGALGGGRWRALCRPPPPRSTVTGIAAVGGLRGVWVRRPLAPEPGLPVAPRARRSSRPPRPAPHMQPPARGGAENRGGRAGHPWRAPGRRVRGDNH